MKVIIISQASFPKVIGGSYRFVYDLIKGFSENEIAWELVTLKPKKEEIFLIKKKNNDLDETFYENELNRGRIIELYNFKSNMIYNFTKLLKLLKNIGNEDLIYIHNSIPGFLFIFAGSKNRRIYFFHGPAYKEYKAAKGKKGIVYFLLYFLQKLIISRSREVHVLSNYMATEVRKIHPKANVKVVPPLFDYSKFTNKNFVQKDSLRKKYNIPLDKIVLITSRRLTNRTGVLELVNAFKKMDNDLYHLIIVGTGELKDKLIKEIHNIQNISYMGFVDDKSLQELMSLSDIYVLPTKELEGFGLVILEALATGIPVIVSDRAGGGKEFIEKNFGKDYIFSLNDMPKSLENSIKKVLSKKLNYSEFVKKFDRKNIAKLIFKMLKESFQN